MTEEEELKYWNDEAQAFLFNLTKDRLTNIMMLSFELRNKYRLGMEDGVKKYNNEPRE